MVLGEPIPAAELARLPRGEVAGVLRRRTIGLSAEAGGKPAGNLDEVFHWPKHVKW
jgi:hypothetical protein